MATDKAMEICPDCYGAGGDNNTFTCTRCDGQGMVPTTSPPESAGAMGETEHVATAIGYALCEMEEDTLAHGLTLDEWRKLATAAMSAMSPANERVAELEAKVHEQAMEYLALDGQAVELMAKVAAMKAAGDRLAVFAGHSDGCDLIASPWTDPGPECDCGYTKAWQAWSTANGD